MSSHPAKLAQRRPKVIQAGEGMHLNVQGIVMNSLGHKVKRGAALHSALERAKDAAKGREVRIDGGLQPFSSISARDLSVNCISHFVRSSWVQERIYSPALTWPRSVFTTPKIFPASTRCMWS
jgi:hypothetical protein